MNFDNLEPCSDKCLVFDQERLTKHKESPFVEEFFYMELIECYESHKIPYMEVDFDWWGDEAMYWLYVQGVLHMQVKSHMSGDVLLEFTPLQEVLGTDLKLENYFINAMLKEHYWITNAMLTEKKPAAFLEFHEKSRSIYHLLESIDRADYNKLVSFRLMDKYSENKWAVQFIEDRIRLLSGTSENS